MDERTATVLVREEYYVAKRKFPPFTSTHEGYMAIIKKVENMYDEWLEIERLRSTGNLKKEAIQVAAQALRFLIDLC